jgi:flagellar motor switch protein FliM
MQTTANIVVKLGEANVDLQDIINLEIGDIIQLDRDATIPLDVMVEGVPKFKGIPGLVKGNRAIRITESMFE